MLKIGLVYINAVNLGDIVIYNNSGYLIKRIMSELNITDYSLIPICMGKRKSDTHFRIKAKRKKIVTKLASTSYTATKKEKMILDAWHLSDEYLYFAEYEAPVIETLDIIIFAGGGLIKYKKQTFHLFIHEITQIANRNNIPVIINSAGVEGYEEDDVECQLLNRALIRSCV